MDDDNLLSCWDTALAGARRHALRTRNEGGGVMGDKKYWNDEAEIADLRTEIERLKRELEEAGLRQSDLEEVSRARIADMTGKRNRAESRVAELEGKLLDIAIDRDLFAGERDDALKAMDRQISRAEHAESRADAAGKGEGEG